MPKFERIDQDTFREQNAEELERRAEKRMAEFVDTLENQPLEMDMSKDAAEDVTMDKYRKNATSGLRAILARAAAADAKAHGQD